ncbi:MAG: cobalt-precorrin-5B (C(1))-methyltransferase, partial [Rhodomicrobium sp.]|nr:cobalt-precorrin-5B (C(1))-methyltransferase [Rhodomicrobium sp.]
ANTAQEILQLAEQAKMPLATYVADLAREKVQNTLNNNSIAADTVIAARDGRIVGRSTPEAPLTT